MDGLSNKYIKRQTQGEHREIEKEKY